MASDDICEICKQPVVSGQARHGATGNHYDCHYPNGRKSDKELFADIDNAVARAQAAIDSLASKRATPFPRMARFNESTPGRVRHVVDTVDMHSIDSRITKKVVVGVRPIPVDDDEL